MVSLIFGFDSESLLKSREGGINPHHPDSHHSYIYMNMTVIKHHVFPEEQLRLGISCRLVVSYVIIGENYSLITVRK